MEDYGRGDGVKWDGKQHAVGGDEAQKEGYHIIPHLRSDRSPFPSAFPSAPRSLSTH